MRLQPSQTSFPSDPSPPDGNSAADPYHGKWIALSNTTVGVLMAMINFSIMLISLPDIFRGIGINPLVPANSGYLLWMLMGYMVVSAVLVVGLGRLGDMFGRVRMFTLGFAVFTLFSVLLAATWMHGTSAALYLIVMRVLQGVGGAMLMANSSAILTDAFPADQRGLALGINNVAGIAGSFLGLVIGGLLAPLDWRLVFLVSVPIGIFGTIWAYFKLEEHGLRRPAKMDWWGGLTFAVGLVSVLVGITYGIEPYKNHTMGWTSPFVMTSIIGGLLVLAVFVVLETRVDEPMFHIPLFKIRPFLAGNIANLLASMGRGGLMFILIIWLQGIWLPQHGYSFDSTPLWAGIYMLPMTVGFLISGPASGFLSDRFGARPFAVGGMLVAATSFYLLELLPSNFPYPAFGAIILLNGLGMGLFASPNRAAVMNSVPADQRGAASGMVATFQNASMVLSIGAFFSLMISGLAGHLPRVLLRGLLAQGVPFTAATKIAHLPAVGSLFAAFLGYNPMKQLLGPVVLNHVGRVSAARITGHSFFPRLLSGPFLSGLHAAFDFALVVSVLAAVASWIAGGKFHHGQVSSGQVSGAQVAEGQVAEGQVAEGQVAEGQVAEGQVLEGQVQSGSAVNQEMDAQIP